MVKTRRQDDGVTVDSNAETDTEIQTDYSDFEMPVNVTVIVLLSPSTSDPRNTLYFQLLGLLLCNYNVFIGVQPGSKA